MRRILITGGFGYIGSRLTPHLLALGHDVRVLDALIYSDAGLEALKKNASFPEWQSRFDFIQGDIRDPEAVGQAVCERDVVIHLAALANAPVCEKDEITTRQINFDAVGLLLRMAKDAGVRRFIHTSTHSVVGSRNGQPLTEDLEPEPTSLYTKYKALAEWLVLDSAGDGFETVVLRPATICGYSPRQRLDLTANHLIAHALRGEVLTVHGSGEQCRPSVGMNDVLNIYDVLLNAQPEIINRKVFNFGFESLRVLDIVEVLKEQIGECNIRHTSPTDEQNYLLNSEKIQNELGYQPVSNLEKEIAELRAAMESGHCADIQSPAWYNTRSFKTQRRGSCYQIFQ